MACKELVPSSYHTSSNDSQSFSDKVGSSEHTVLTETRCMTETTMRMEHKSPLPDIESPRLYIKSPFPSPNGQNKIQSFKNEQMQSKSCKESFNENLFSNNNPLQSELDRSPNKLQSSMNSSETIKYSVFKTSPPTNLLPCKLNKSTLRDEMPKDVCVDKQNELKLTPGPLPKFGYLPDDSVQNNSPTKHIIEQQTSEIIRNEISGIPANIPESFVRSPVPVSTPQSFTSAPIGTENQEILRRNSIRETAKAIENKIKEIESSSYELKAPCLVRDIIPRKHQHVSSRPASAPLHDINIQPGSPPELCFAPQITHDKKSIYPETSKKCFEQNNRPIQLPPTPVKMMESPCPLSHRLKISINPVQIIKDRESSGYSADTEESRFSSSIKTEQIETRSARQYFQRIEKSNNAFSPFDIELNRFPQKVRLEVQFMCV